MNVWCARWPPLAGFIYARAVDELGPCGLLGPLEDGASAMLALDVAGSLDEVVPSGSALCRLGLEQLVNELGSGGLFWYLLLMVFFVEVRLATVEFGLAGLLQLLFKHHCCQPLVDSSAAYRAHWYPLRCLVQV